MSTGDLVSFECTIRVRDTCLCLQVHRAARTLARLFDEALAPVGITNGQFSLLMSLNRPEPPTMGAVSQLLALDRTTLTANLKPLVRRKLVKVVPDKRDRRTRRILLTAQGQKVLASAVPIWEKSHAALERRFERGADALRADLQKLV